MNENNIISFKAETDHADVDDASALNPIKHNGKAYQVNGLLNDNKITYDVILFNGLVELYNDNDALVDVYDVKLDMTVNMATISHAENGNIICTFKFQNQDNYITFDKITEIRHALKMHGFDDKLADDMQVIIRNYFLNNHECFNQIIDADDESNDDVYDLNERTNPPYNKQIANRFAKKLADEYDNSIIKYFKDVTPDVILNETNNVIKITLACITVILGIYGMFIELIGDSGIGKSFVMDTVLQKYIPDKYVLDFNAVTEPAFLLYCRESRKFFNGIIITFGDLGDPLKFKKLADVFDIIKILITDHFYNYVKTEKNRQGNWSDLAKLKLHSDTLCAIYGTVAGDNQGFNGDTDVKDQKQSRTLNCTPNETNENEMRKFDDECNVKGTYLYDSYNQACNSLSEYQEWLKMKISEYDKDKYIITKPFRHLFIKMTKYSAVQIRTVKQLTNMLVTLTYLNYERSIKVKGTDGNIYIVPCCDDVQDFINATYDGAGLKVYERQLLLKLKDEFCKIKRQAINDETMKLLDAGDNAENETYELINDEIVKYDVYSDDEIKAMIDKAHAKANKLDEFEIDDLQGKSNNLYLLRKYETMDILLQDNGLSSENRKYNKAFDDEISALKKKARKSGIDDKTLQKRVNDIASQKKAQVFFTIPELKRIFSNHNAIKNTPIMQKTIDVLCEKQFIKKMDYKNSRKQNVFCLMPEILEIHNDYKLSYNDKMMMICVLLDGFKYIDAESIKPICKDYHVKLDDLVHFYEKAKTDGVI